VRCGREQPLHRGWLSDELFALADSSFGLGEVPQDPDAGRSPRISRPWLASHAQDRLLLRLRRLQAERRRDQSGRQLRPLQPELHGRARRFARRRVACGDQYRGAGRRRSGLSRATRGCRSVCRSWALQARMLVSLRSARRCRDPLGAMPARLSRIRSAQRRFLHAVHRAIARGACGWLSNFSGGVNALRLTWFVSVAFAARRCRPHRSCQKPMPQQPFQSRRLMVSRATASWHTRARTRQLSQGALAANDRNPPT